MGHWATSSADSSICSVEPGNVDDIGKIVSAGFSRRKSRLIKYDLYNSCGSLRKTRHHLLYAYTLYTSYPSLMYLAQVKGGGHTSNPGFSSTPGVQIAMYRFSEVNYKETSQTVDIGAGLIWDDVYAALEPFGITVVGGRVSGVGVAGFTLGGGRIPSRSSLSY